MVSNCWPNWLASCLQQALRICPRRFLNAIMASITSLDSGLAILEAFSILHLDYCFNFLHCLLPFFSLTPLSKPLSSHLRNFLLVSPLGPASSLSLSLFQVFGLTCSSSMTLIYKGNIKNHGRIGTGGKAFLLMENN